MTLDIALDADGEWDSSTGWSELARRSRHRRDRRKRLPATGHKASGRCELSVRLAGDEEVRS